ncbi:DUF5949 family protein [Streptomyces pristinaespiralis]|jgi:hypothetical protein|uniref:DUF5949 family protein n=1 Tax=Streptomyces pristinaespiralis TaxID=38300 RepID=UPI003838B27A
MTTANTPRSAVNRSRLGTLSLLAWTGDPAQGHDTPYLLTYSLGDGVDGPAAGEEAALAMITELGLTVGDEMHDHTHDGSHPIQLLVEGGQAVVNMPYLKAQCPAPPEWLAAADRRGHVHFMIASRPWPEGRPGEPVSDEAFQSFLGDETTLVSSAHVLLPVSRLRG